MQTPSICIGSVREGLLKGLCGLSSRPICLAGSGVLPFPGRGSRIVWPLMWLMGSGRAQQLRPPSLLTPRPLTPPVWSTTVAISSSSQVASSPREEEPGYGEQCSVPVRRHQLHGLSAASAAKRARADHTDRGAALATIFEIVCRQFPRAPSVLTVLAEGEAFSSESVSASAMVEGKATSTLLGRASSLRMYDTWFVNSSIQTPFDAEATVFEYCTELHRDAAPASRASALVATLNFIDGVFGISFAAVRASARVRGMCVRSLRTRAAVCQRRPFTVDLVKELECILSDDRGRGLPDGVLAGAALFAIFSRSRIGDLRRCAKEPVLDTVGDFGYMETAFLEHKTARAGTKKALPIVAPARGLVGPWAQDWARTRRGAGLDAAKNGTMLPALGDNGQWLNVSYTTVEFASAVREVLLRRGVPGESLNNIGAHSMKATLLSWAAKFGIDKVTRRTLGYHAEPGDRSVETYSRDAMAAPLRHLDRVLEAVRRGAFHPDSTRSGFFRGGEDHPGDVLPQVPETGVAAVLKRGPRRRSPSRLHRDLSGAPGLAARGVPRAGSSAPSGPPSAPCRPPSSSSASTASAASSSSEDPGAAQEVEEPEFDSNIMVSKRSRIHHATLDGLQMLCGKSITEGYERVRALPSGARMCRQCF